MGWTQVKVDDLPQIIAGPIVRKTTLNSVTVWVAVKSATPITLKVYAPWASSPTLTSAATTPVRIGSHLFVACITATGGSINSNVSWGYDLEFGSQHLNSSGILSSGVSGIGKVTFSGDSERYKSSQVRLPSFLSLPPDINSLNILHGSCRKPHGGGVDGMVIYHDTIKKFFDQGSGGTVVRPQILCLTGDQIYGDDVSAILLHQIIRYHETDSNNKSLIGWKENLPHVPGTINNSNPMAAGNRHLIIRGELDIIAEESDTHSHLLRMTEYLLMYCMVWSEELWTDTLPTYDQAYYGAPETYVETVSGPEGVAINTTRKTTKYKRYLDDKPNINRFKNTLEKVRRVLANISTYMVFDDHDVTDDLFLSRKWTENVLYGYNNNNNKKELGQRLMQNGLCGIAICQSWGNNPDQFTGASSAGKKITNAVESLTELYGQANSSQGDTHWEVIGDMVLPYIDWQTDPVRMRHHSGSFNWHWYFERGDYEFIGLDTRTFRVFRNGYDEYSGLISDEAMDLQVTNVGPSINTKELTIVLSGAPVFGVPSTEDVIFDIVDYFKQKEDIDLEFWNLDSHARQALISKLLKRKEPNGAPARVLILSGDVHYAFTNAVNYKFNSSFIHHYGPGFELKIAQCCSSALKNKTTSGTASTLGQHDRKITDKWKNLYDEDDNNIDVYGWNNADVTADSITPTDFNGSNYPNRKVWGQKHIPSEIRAQKLASTWELPVTPEPLNGKYTPTPLQDWFYSLSFVVNTPVYTTAITPPGGQNFDLAAARSKVHKEISSEDNKSSGAWLVGYPNAGNIEFRWSNDWGGIKEVQHNIIWISKSGEKAVDAGTPIVYVVTEHTVALT